MQRNAPNAERCSREASTSSNAPWHAVNERRTSHEKSTWPNTQRPSIQRHVVESSKCSKHTRRVDQVQQEGVILVRRQHADMITKVSWSDKHKHWPLSEAANLAD